MADMQQFISWFKTIIFYEILVGKLPYTGNDALSTALAHLTEPLPDLPVHHGRYQDVLRKLLAKDPAERFPDAAALLRALDNLPDESAEATLIRPLSLQLPETPKPVDDLAGLTPMSIDIPSGPAYSPPPPQSQPKPVAPPIKPPVQSSVSAWPTP